MDFVKNTWEIDERDGGRGDRPEDLHSDIDQKLDECEEQVGQCHEALPEPLPERDPEVDERLPIIKGSLRDARAVPRLC